MKTRVFNPRGNEARAKVASMKHVRTGRFAVIKAEINGAMTTWRPGDTVRAYFVRGSWWAISRMKWRKPKLPLFNACVVTRHALTLGEPIPANEIPEWDRK